MINNDENIFYKEFSMLKNEYLEWERTKNKHNLYKLDAIQNNLYLLEGNLTEFIGKKYKNKKDNPIYTKNIKSLLQRIHILQLEVYNKQKNKNYIDLIIFHLIVLRKLFNHVFIKISSFIYYVLMIIITEKLCDHLKLSFSYNLITIYILFTPLLFLLIHNLDKVKSISKKKLKTRKYKHWRK